VSRANPTFEAPSSGTSATAWLILALLSLAVLLGMSVWFTASATSTQLRAVWNLTESQAGWLTTTVQLGFVAGTALAAVLNLADVIPSRRYFAVSAILAAAANAALLVSPSYAPAIACRFLTGLFLAGVYPPAMKMIATWFLDARGLAIGTVVGALTVGKALPFLVSALEGLDYRPVVLTASAGALLAALLVGAMYRDGPYPFERRAFSWGLVGTVVHNRESRLAIGGYLGHMWELYACWSLLALFFGDFFQGRGATVVQAGTTAGLVAFAAIAMGGLGSVMAGQWADRLGRERITIWSMIVSGACSLVIGWLTFLPPSILVGLALVWGFAIVADSAQFSALVTEVAPKHAVGTALTLQTSLGFLLTALSIWLAVEVSRRIGWGPAFSMLAVGPALGIWAMAILKRARSGVGPT
jgi:MFS family permease